MFRDLYERKEPVSSRSICQRSDPSVLVENKKMLPRLTPEAVPHRMVPFRKNRPGPARRISYAAEQTFPILKKTGTVWNTLHTIPALKDTKEYCRNNPHISLELRETKENSTKRIDNRADPLYNFSCVSLQNSCVWLLSPTISIPLELELQGEAHMKFTVKGLRRSFLFVSSSINPVYI